MTYFSLKCPDCHEASGLEISQEVAVTPSIFRYIVKKLQESQKADGFECGNCGSLTQKLHWTILAEDNVVGHWCSKCLKSLTFKNIDSVDKLTVIRAVSSKNLRRRLHIATSESSIDAESTDDLF